MTVEMKTGAAGAPEKVPYVINEDRLSPLTL
jgi:hypothetical protein